MIGDFSLGMILAQWFIAIFITAIIMMMVWVNERNR